MFLETTFVDGRVASLTVQPTYATRRIERMLIVASGLLASALRYVRRGDVRGLIRKTGESFLSMATVRRQPRHQIGEIVDALRHTSERPFVIIDHNMGGGANLYRDRLLKERRASGQPVILMYCASLGYRIRYVHHENDWAVSAESFDMLSEIARVVAFDEILVNNVVFFEEPLFAARYVPHLRDLSHAKLTIAIHDYFSVCPSWVLLDNHGRFCNVPAIERCRECLASHKGSFLPLAVNRNIDEWREAWGRCLATADTILCFSHSSATLVRRAYPTLDTKKILVRAHVVDYLLPRKPAIALDSALNIGVVGNITEHKGSGIVKRVAELIAERRLPIRITIIGTIDVPCKRSIVHITGPYKRQDLARIIEQYGVNVCFLPSISPETFSYVTEELISLEVPIAVFDIGAPPERVRKYQYGLVLKEIDAKIALDGLMAFHAALGQRAPMHTAAEVEFTQ